MTVTVTWTSKWANNEWTKLASVLFFNRKITVSLSSVAQRRQMELFLKVYEHL